MTSILCTRCRNPLPHAIINQRAFNHCIFCRSRIKVEAYPAYLRAPEASNRGEQILLDGEAACFYHSLKKASVPCDSCGRFLCALCDIELNDQHLCPACMESGKRKKKLEHLEDQRVLYGRMSLVLAIIPVIFVWPTCVTAPAVLYMTVRYWNAPSSIVRPGKAYFVIASFLAACQLAGWCIFLGSYFMETRTF